MRALLLAALLAPVAAATAAYPDGAQWGDREATVPLRVEGALRVEADLPIEAGLAAPGAVPDGWVTTPAQLEGRPGTWRGLEGILVLWLRRASAEAVVVEVADEAREGVVLEWPAKRQVPGPGPFGLALALALALVSGCGRRSPLRPRGPAGRS